MSSERRPENAIPLDPLDFTLSITMAEDILGREGLARMRVDVRGSEEPLLIPESNTDLYQLALKASEGDVLQADSFIVRWRAWMVLTLPGTLARAFPNHSPAVVEGAAIELAASFPVTPGGRFDQVAFLAALGQRLAHKQP